jgi:hypothetical protein
MKVRIPRRLAALAGVGGVLAVAATGCGADGGTATAAGNNSSGSAQTQNGQQAGPGRGGAGMMDTAALAKKLGVTQAKLKTALESVRPEQGSAPQPGDMAAKLAKALGLSQANVQAALKAVMPAGGPPSGGQGGTPPSGAPGGTTS